MFKLDLPSPVSDTISSVVSLPRNCLPHLSSSSSQIHREHSNTESRTVSSALASLGPRAGTAPCSYVSWLECCALCPAACSVTKILLKRRPSSFAWPGQRLSLNWYTCYLNYFIECQFTRKRPLSPVENYHITRVSGFLLLLSIQS